MSGTLVSAYGIGDTNFDNMMLTLDRAYSMQLSISEYKTDAVPVIEAGAVVDIGGALYKFASDETISTTDPYTSATIVDGMAYIVLQLILGTASGATTDATGYAIGSTVITLANVGTGTILIGDRITFAGDTVSYEVTSGDSDVSNGGSITIASPGLLTAIPASATAITISSGSISASWTNTDPVWRGDYNGWYKSGTVDRYVAGCNLYGISTTPTYDDKYMLRFIDDEAKTRISVLHTSLGTVNTDYNPLIFNASLFDTKNEYNSTTGIATIKKKGYYDISTHIYFETDIAVNYMQFEVYIYVNTSAMAFSKVYHDYTPNFNRFDECELSKILKLDVGDTVHVRVRTYSHTFWRGSDEKTYLTIHEI